MAEYIIDKIEYGGNVYKLQDNESGYTTNTGTVTSVGVSNATDGGLSVSGSPVTGSGNITVGHSNVLTSAQTTQAVYPIKIDKNGHISAYGSAQTIPTASTTTPSMDGTASYGSGTSYARSNHVHPTDTSRQATLVSGTNIKTIDSTSLLGSGDIVTRANWYGTCSTTGSSGTKVVTCANYVLKAGDIIAVTFTAPNLANPVSLNVNSTGAKTVYYNGAATSSSNQLNWVINSTLTFLYDGSNYQFLSNSKLDNSEYGAYWIDLTSPIDTDAFEEALQANKVIGAIDSNNNLFYLIYYLRDQNDEILEVCLADTSVYDDELAAGSLYWISDQTQWGTGDIDSNGWQSYWGYSNLNLNWLNGSSVGSVRTSGSENESTAYTIGDYAVAEGFNSRASGEAAHAEGSNTVASGDFSHAEGDGSAASGETSHAEGCSIASGDYSHSEGAGDTEASGDISHAEGYGTIAQRKSQHVFGEYNIADTTGADGTVRGTYVEIVGNGTSNLNSDRSNARTLDWNGNEVLAGKLTVGAGPTNNLDVATKQYVDSNTSSATNWLNGSATGSVRTIGSAEEDASYTIGNNSVVEGYLTKASGSDAHAEGCQTTASSLYSHAEGYQTTASANAAHAEGQNTTASGADSHAEGYQSTASGSVSHVEGFGTVAQRRSQHVFGEYNVLDATGSATNQKGAYIEIVGNGTNSSTRSNARTLDWSGNEELSGTLTLAKGTADEITLNPKYVMANVALGTPVVVCDTTTVSFSKDGDNDWYISAENPISGLTQASFLDNNIYKIEWDGVEYEAYYRKAECPNASGGGFYDWGYLGNVTALGWAPCSKNDTLTPFCVEYDFKQNAGEVQIISYDTASSHSIKITRIPFDKNSVDRALYQDEIGIRDGSGNGAIVVGLGPIDARGSDSVAINGATIASGNVSFAAGQRSQATAHGAFAIGGQTIASGDYSFAGGNYNGTLGNTEATAAVAFAFGLSAKATAQNSFSLGQGTTASATLGFATGDRTVASGSRSFTGGDFTVANHRAQVAFGQYNVADTSAAAASARGTYIEIVGNGTADNARSNARTLDWDGNETLAGKLTLGAAPTANMDAATKQYVDNCMTVVTFTPDAANNNLIISVQQVSSIQNGNEVSY